MMNNPRQHVYRRQHAADSPSSSHPPFVVDHHQSMPGAWSPSAGYHAQSNYYHYPPMGNSRKLVKQVHHQLSHSVWMKGVHPSSEHYLPASTGSPKASSMSAMIHLNRKAFVSLEKSIDWQHLLATTPKGTTKCSSNVIVHQSSGRPPPSSHHQTSMNHIHTNHDSLQDNPKRAVTGKSSSTHLAVPPPCRSSMTFDFSQPGMKDVPAWLKLLRLHKYACLFTGMCYQQMLNMTEQDLEHRNITKGARQKLILSIEKLKARCTVLVASEHRLLQPTLAHCTHHHASYAPVPYKLLHQVLFQIRAFLSTPIPPQKLATDGDSIGTNRHEPSCSLAMLLARTPTDLNNNSSSISNRNHRHHEHNDQLVDYSSCMGVWLSLWQQQPWTPSHQQHNDTQLVIVMTRLVGHVYHILLGKSRKRSKKFALWNFQQELDQIHEINQAARECKCFTNEYCSSSSPTSSSCSSPDVSSSHKQQHSLATSNCVHYDKDSGVEGDDGGSSGSSIGCHSDDSDDAIEEDCSTTDSVADGCGRNHSLSLEEEKELILMVKGIVERCLEHEAFTKYHSLLLHWSSQVSILDQSAHSMDHEPRKLSNHTNRTVELGNQLSKEQADNRCHKSVLYNQLYSPSSSLPFPVKSNVHHSRFVHSRPTINATMDDPQTLFERSVPLSPSSSCGLAGRSGGCDSHRTPEAANLCKLLFMYNNSHHYHRHQPRPPKLTKQLNSSSPSPSFHHSTALSAAPLDASKEIKSDSDLSLSLDEFIPWSLTDRKTSAQSSFESSWTNSTNNVESLSSSPTSSNVGESSSFHLHSHAQTNGSVNQFINLDQDIEQLCIRIAEQALEVN